MFPKSIKLKFFRVLFIPLFICCSLSAENPDELLQTIFQEGVSIDLREPMFSQDVFTTDKGGVIIAPKLRIQAQHIEYTRKLNHPEPIHRMTAEGHVMIEYGEYVFVGERLDYDFIKKTGTIHNGRTGVEPWFVGGGIIRLYEDGTYVIENAFITTDENSCPDWKIAADYTSLQEHRFLCAKQVKFRFFDTPLFWLPTFEMDLDTIFESPVRYNVKWGGSEGPRAGLIYEVFSWKRFRTYLRLDYRLNRGPGGGVETRYSSPDHKEYFQTINYIARDSSVFLPNERTRYRFQGAYSNLLYHDSISIDLTYDKLSDKFMATDYDDEGLDLETAGRTELDIRRQERNWTANVYTRLRINSFETVKQELPTFMNSWRPFVIGPTGIISDNQFQVSYLDYSYANHLNTVNDYSATRIAFSHQLYRSFVTDVITITPEAGMEAIFYGNGPHGVDARWLVLAELGCEATAPIYRYYDDQKHVIEPYIDYSFFSTPTLPPKKHYIFDIDDGWVYLNRVRFGTRNSLYRRDCNSEVSKYLSLDLYANAFIDVHTIPQTIPKVYADTVWRPNDYLKYTLCTGWDLEEHQLDHFNARVQWTANEDFAVATEYRYRSAYDWRKADHTNFMVDAYHTIEELKHSSMSDRRNTLLFHAFYRFYPNWAFEYSSRHGWNRRHEKSYNEFELDLITTIYSAGQVRLSYQHKEGENRVAIYFSVGLKRPDNSSDCIIPFLEF